MQPGLSQTASEVRWCRQTRLRMTPDNTDTDMLRESPEHAHFKPLLSHKSDRAQRSRVKGVQTENNK